MKDAFRVDRKTVPILSTAQELLEGLSPQSLSGADPGDVVVAPPALEGLGADPEEVELEALKVIGTEGISHRALLVSPVNKTRK